MEQEKELSLLLSQKSAAGYMIDGVVGEFLILSRWILNSRLIKTLKALINDHLFIIKIETNQIIVVVIYGYLKTKMHIMLPIRKIKESMENGENNIF